MLSRIVCMDQVRPLICPKDIRVQRLDWNWNDPSEVVQQQLKSIGPKVQKGCWYINPMFRVFGPEPSRDFLSMVYKRRKEWFRVLSRQFGTANWKRKMDVTTNVFERRTTFTGILIIDGKVIDPLTEWQLEVNVGLRSQPDLVISRRLDARACVKQQDWNSLKEIARCELQQQLSANPTEPLYVNPGISVMGFQANPDFYSEVQKRLGEWNWFLRNTLGNRNVKTISRDSDWAFRMLIIDGTLVVNGRLYLPGCWPNQQPTRKRLQQTPFGSATIPPDCLGLHLQLQ